MIEAKNCWRKRERGRGREKGLCIIETYTQVENALSFHSRYLEILYNCLVLTGIRDTSWTAIIGGWNIRG